MRKTGVDKFSSSLTVRGLAVVGWFTISTMAFISRYERWTPALGAIMVTVILGIGVFGLTWAALPYVRQRDSRKLTRHRSPLRPTPSPPTAPQLSLIHI